MPQLPIYSTFQEKERVFKSSPYFIISTVKEFDSWYTLISSKQKNASKLVSKNGENEFDDTIYNHYPFIFRGIGEAKYKIFSSAQREWNVNNMSQWAKKNYLEFVNDLVKKASGLPLLAKVFNYYKLHYRQTDFPTLSILQHYKAPTPLIDFTYNLDVALYFAVEFCQPSTSSNDLDHYFSINIIDREIQNKNEFLNLFQFNGGGFPTLESFYDFQFNQNSIFYVTDFENQYSRRNSRGFQDQRPLTILFNQRIIPQEGLFVFNASPSIPLEDCFNMPLENSNLNLKQMQCVNIHKDLSDYVRRKIKISNIEKFYIYPELEEYAKSVKNFVLDELVK